MLTFVKQICFQEAALLKETTITGKSLLWKLQILQVLLSEQFIITLLHSAEAILY